LCMNSLQFLVVVVVDIVQESEMVGRSRNSRRLYCHSNEFVPVAYGNTDATVGAIGCFIQS